MHRVPALFNKSGNMQAVLHYNLSTLKNFPVVQLLQYSAIV